MTEKLDTVVVTVTSGALMTMISEGVSQERFTQLVALNQSMTQAAVVGAWFVAGMLLAYLKVTGLLLVDVLSFIPLTVLLFRWATNVATKNPRTQDTYKSVMNEQRLDILKPVMMFTGVILFGSLINRTTPVLYNALFAAPSDIVLGVLFGIFVIGMVLAGVLTATKRGSRQINSALTRGSTLPKLVLLVGVSICALPFTNGQPALFALDLFNANFESVLIAQAVVRALGAKLEVAENVNLGGYEARYFRGLFENTRILTETLEWHAKVRSLGSAPPSGVLPLETCPRFRTVDFSWLQPAWLSQLSRHVFYTADIDSTWLERLETLYGSTSGSV